MRTFRAKFCNLRHFAPCWLWHVHPKSEWNQYESVLSTSIFSRVLVLAAGPEELHRVVFSFIAHHSIIDPCWLRDIAGLAALIEVALYKIECHTPMEDLWCTVSPFMHSVHDSLHSSHQSQLMWNHQSWLKQSSASTAAKRSSSWEKKSVLQDPIYTSWRGQQLHHRSFHCTMSQKVVHVFLQSVSRRVSWMQSPRSLVPWPRPGPTAAEASWPDVNNDLEDIGQNWQNQNRISLSSRSSRI